MADSPERLRVGIFSNAYRPLISGVVNSIELTRKQLLHQGHVPLVFAPRVRGYREQHAGVWRFPSLELTRNVQYPLPVPGWPPLHHLIGRSRVQVLHSHHPFLLGDYAWYWARRRRIPLVYTFHTQYEQYTHYVPLPQGPLKWLCRLAVRQYARRCDLIIAPSPTIRDLLDQYGIATWTVTLQNAIDLSRFEQLPDRQLLRQQLGWPQEARVALYAGRLGKEKNLDFLLEAHRRVHAQDARAQLMILGDGPERTRLQSQGLPGVHFLGPCSYADVPRYFGAADFFTICSTTEVKPLVVLEALAAGLPVVAVSACGTQDTLSDGFDGLLTPHRLEPFAASWLRLVEDPDLVQRLSEGALQTAGQYGIETYGQKLVELYREALARQRPLGGA